MTMLTAIEGITAPLIPAAHPATAAPRAADTRPHTGDDLPSVAPFTHDALRALTPSSRSTGWTPDRQRVFLDAVATGVTVEDAAALAGLSAASAYAFRKRAAGAAFAVGWSAALLLQRNRLADDLMARALTGVTDTVTNARGEVCRRHRHDNRLALAMLTRLDKVAAADVPDRTGDARAARLAAQDWDRYLDLIGADASPAQAGLFLSLRSTESEAAAIAPIVALARADLYQRTGAGHSREVQVHDLDPARRHEWSAADWARAEAGGLLTLAAAGADEPHTSQLPQLADDDAPGVWWCDEAEDWRTAFPPPAGFDGWEEADYGTADYSRALGDDERAAVETWQAREVEAKRLPAEAERVRFFADLLAEDVGADATAAPSDPCSGEGRSAGGREAVVATAPTCAGAREGAESGDNPHSGCAEAVEDRPFPGRADVVGNRPLPVRAEPVEACPERLPHPGSRRAPPLSSGREGDASGCATPSPRTVRAELVEAQPCSSGHKDDENEAAPPLPRPVRAEPVEALPFASSREADANEGATQSPNTVRAELVEAPYFGPRTVTSEQEEPPLERLRRRGHVESANNPTGPDAEVNSASSDGAKAPPAGAGAGGRVRSFATA